MLTAKQVGRVTFTKATTQVIWNPIIQYQFATRHNQEVYLWDLRKFAADQEIASFLATLSPLKQIQFDPQYGKLLLTQDKDTVKLFNVND